MPHWEGIFKHMEDEKLINWYVPDVYQPDIYTIDYKKLKERGIKLITFDLDDTIVPKITNRMPNPAPTLMSDLKKMGFNVMLISNSKNKKKVEGFAEKLNVEYSIAEAKKPGGEAFEKARKKYPLEEKQIAHVGNSIMNDVGGANPSGIITCLVRYVGDIPHNVIQVDKTLKAELKKRKLWQKHHIEQREDQYYQLGEIQKGSSSKVAEIKRDKINGML